MKYRQLGNTGLLVSEIGMGCWGIGGDAYGKTDDDESRATLETAFLNGINFFDTADVYGNGHSEELIGEVFHDRRHEVIIATKGGALPHGHDEPMPQDFSESHLREALEGSLRRLRTDYIDVYQLHSPDYSDLSDTLDIISEFRKEGKVREIGVSLVIPDVDHCCMADSATIIQTNFSMVDQRILDIDSVLDWCKWYKVGLIARTPLCFGFLSNQLTFHDVMHNWYFEQPDHRAMWNSGQLVRWTGAIQKFEHLYGNRTPAQFALGFCLSFPISTVIPGMMHPHEVLENVRSTPLEDWEVDAVREIYAQHEFFIGR